MEIKLHNFEINLISLELAFAFRKTLCIQLNWKCEFLKKKMVTTAHKGLPRNHSAAISLSSSVIFKISENHFEIYENSEML